MVSPLSERPFLGHCRTHVGSTGETGMSTATGTPLPGQPPVPWLGAVLLQVAIRSLTLHPKVYEVREKHTSVGDKILHVTGIGLLRISRSTSSLLSDEGHAGYGKDQTWYAPADRGWKGTFPAPRA